MKIITFPVGQLQANCYLIIDIKTHEAVILDPGDDADLIISTIQQEDIKPLAILATHGHFDHVMAALEVQLAFDLPFFIHPKDQFLLDRLQQTAQYFLGPIEVPPPPKQVQFINQKQIAIGSFKFDVLETPGHTPGSVSFYHSKSQSLFSGDVLFANGGFGRTDFVYCSKPDLDQSIQMLMQLPNSTKIFCGHGEATSVEQEKKFWREK